MGSLPVEGLYRVDVVVDRDLYWGQFETSLVFGNDGTSGGLGGVGRYRLSCYRVRQCLGLDSCVG